MNIFEPNPDGTYWMQYVIHNNYFSNEENSSYQFQKWTRNIIKKLKVGMVVENQIVQTLLAQKLDVWIQNSTDDLHDIVKVNDLEKVKIYLALGALSKSGHGSNILACSKMGYYEIAKELLSNYNDPNDMNNNHENCFWLASVNKHFELATLLRKYGANPDIISDSGYTLLHISYLNKKIELFNYLLDAGASPNIKDLNKETVQYLAYAMNDKETGEMLQDKYHGDINVLNKDELSLGHIATDNNDPGLLEYYLTRGLDVNIKGIKGFSIFHYAFLKNCNQNIWDLLVSHEADIDLSNDEKESPLISICKCKKLNRVGFDYLLAHHCNINCRDESKGRAISYLIQNENDDEVEILLNTGAEIVDHDSQLEPIWLALQRKNEKLFKLLISKGATAGNITVPVIDSFIHMPFFDLTLLKQMKEFNTSIGCPIHSALELRYNEAASFLWEVSPQDKKTGIAQSTSADGKILLSWAIIADNSQLVEELINQNYPVFALDSYQNSPLTYACIRNKLQWMYNLANIYTPSQLDPRDSNNRSAITYAATNNQEEFCKFLFIKGCDVRLCELDPNGIIQKYRAILDEFDYICDTGEKLLELAQKSLNESEQAYLKTQEELSEATTYYFLSKRDSFSELFAKDRMDDLNDLSLRQFENIELKGKIYDKCREILIFIGDATRKDVLEKMEIYRSKLNDMQSLLGDLAKIVEPDITDQYLK